MVDGQARSALLIAAGCALHAAACSGASGSGVTGASGASGASHALGGAGGADAHGGSGATGRGQPREFLSLWEVPIPSFSGAHVLSHGYALALWAREAASGDILVAGSMQGELTVTDDAGAEIGSGPLHQTTFVMSLDPSLRPSWVLGAGDATETGACAFVPPALLADGSVGYVDQSSRGSDFNVVRAAADGSTVWSVQVPAACYQGLAVDADGDLLALASHGDRFAPEPLLSLPTSGHAGTLVVRLAAIDGALVGAAPLPARWTRAHGIEVDGQGFPIVSLDDGGAVSALVRLSSALVPEGPGSWTQELWGLRRNWVARDDGVIWTSSPPAGTERVVGAVEPSLIDLGTGARSDAPPLPLGFFIFDFGVRAAGTDVVVFGEYTPLVERFDDPPEGAFVAALAPDGSFRWYLPLPEHVVHEVLAIGDRLLVFSQTLIQGPGDTKDLDPTAGVQELAPPEEGRYVFVMDFALPR